MTPKVQIGAAYERRHFERRDRDGAYSALRPAMSRDAELLQRALLSVRPTLAERIESLMVRRFS